LLGILEELEHQQHVAATYSDKFLSYTDEMKQIREFIEVGEYGLAYEYLVGAIELHLFVLSGKAVIALLELGLTFGFKTERSDDIAFDRRDVK
jgi:hypothetical protein